MWYKICISIAKPYFDSWFYTYCLNAGQSKESDWWIPIDYFLLPFNVTCQWGKISFTFPDLEKMV